MAYFLRFWQLTIIKQVQTHPKFIVSFATAIIYIRLHLTRFSLPFYRSLRKTMNIFVRHRQGIHQLPEILNRICESQQASADAVVFNDAIRVYVNRVCSVNCSNFAWVLCVFTCIYVDVELCLHLSNKDSCVWWLAIARIPAGIALCGP